MLLTSNFSPVPESLNSSQGCMDRTSPYIARTQDDHRRVINLFQSWGILPHFQTRRFKDEWCRKWRTQNLTENVLDSCRCSGRGLMQLSIQFLYTFNQLLINVPPWRRHWRHSPWRSRKCMCDWRRLWMLNWSWGHRQLWRSFNDVDDVFWFRVWCRPALTSSHILHRHHHHHHHHHHQQQQQQQQQDYLLI